MKRRKFLSILCCGSAGLAAGRDASGLMRSLIPGKRTIGYIRPEIPNVPTPPYEGTHYVDRVPDTYDIAERGRLVLNALTSVTDPDADYEIYFHLRVFSNPPAIAHDFSDWCQEGEGFVEALPLIRQMTGDSLNPEVDRAWSDKILKCIGPDGLFYFPTQGRPWFYHETHRDVFPNRPDPDDHVDMKSFVPTILLASGPASTADTSAYTQFTHPQPCGRLLGTLTIFWLRDHNPIWKQTIERMIDRWSKLAVYKDDYAYFPNLMFGPNAAPVPDDLPIPLGMLSSRASARFVQGLAQYYRFSGYEPARDFAGKLARYMRYHADFFDAHDGSFLAGPPIHKANPSMELDTQGSVYGGHFHGHAIVLTGMLEYGIAVNDRDMIDWVRKSFEWARDHQESVPLVGFFPTQLVPDLAAMVKRTAAGPVESCEVADMITLGVKLSTAGAGDYWDNVDHWLRNQFAENQLTDTDWIYELGKTQDKISILSNESDDRPAERNIGGFAGWSAMNDWVVRHHNHRFGIMHCCTGNAARTIFYTWNHMLNWKDGDLTLHLLMNRAAPQADVYSYIPNQGRVEVKFKEPCRSASLRIPEWVTKPASEITCLVNGKPAHFTVADRYIRVTGLKNGDRLRMDFPIHERTVKLRVINVDYTLVLRGSTVVSIDPPGHYRPYYQRAAYREAEPKMLELKRFNSKQIISW